MSAGYYNKEWATGDIIEATDLNAITPLIFGLLYNDTDEVLETTLTVQEIFDGLVEHNIGIISTVDTEFMIYNLIVIVSVSFEERSMKYYMKGYGSNNGVLSEMNFQASSSSSKFHLVTNP